MNIEDLTKTQLLWLMVLVNFVTSIATCVLTVSLLDVAPPTVTQTVNQIVERTVERVATGTPLATIVTPKPQTQTVVIRDEDLLSAAISADVARTVEIHKGNGTSTPVIAVGTFLPKSKVVVTATVQNLPKEATIEFANGAAVQASLSKPGATLTIYGFADAAVLPSAPSPDLISSKDLKQGQTLVAITATGSAQTGIIAKIDTEGIHSNVSGVPVGAAAVNISGDIIGIATSVPGIFASAEKISTLLAPAP
ncbi:MAG: hypothetical protein JWN64_302 [Parcubacteria group bacterium]|nr:hypothetical protein [Parcubacteria group bacterium]